MRFHFKIPLAILFCILVLIVFKNQFMVYAQNLAPEQQQPAQQQPAQSQSYYEATITGISQNQTGPVATVQITSGDLNGKTAEVAILADPRSTNSTYQKGDQVIILRTEDGQGNEQLTYIVDFVRTPTLLTLGAVFVAFVLFVGRLHGFLSLLGMAYSFLIIGQFVVPNIIAGNNAIFVAIVGGILISPVTFYISHGIKWKTTVAIMGTVVSLLITGLLAALFVTRAKLTGAASDEALFVQSMINSDINLRDLLLGGMIIGSLGILDDITVSQAAIVEKLLKTAKQTSFWEIFHHAMDVGKDHIASLVNTLILVYAGASLPLFLLFYNSGLSYSSALSSEIVATEVVRTLVGSIGLVAAVPITTILACTVLKRQIEKK
jgi:uncharacterized membrane protein